MSDSKHSNSWGLTPVRARLAALAGGEAARAALDSAGHWSSHLHWTEVFGRFYPEAVPYAVQVFESYDHGIQRIARVEAFEAPPPDADDGVWSPAGDIGYFRVTPLTSDPALPALNSILNGDAEAIVVRYHPGLRCTVRTVRNGRAVFAKVFSDDRGRELYDQSERLWRASSTGELAFAVARPIGWDHEERTLWQVALPGYPLRARLGSHEGPALARRVGEALGSLARSGVATQGVFSASDQLMRTERHGEDLVSRVPALADDVQVFTMRLRGSPALIGRRLPRPMHGAPASGQWLATSERLGLLDFDRFAAGDPELDVGVFLADLDFERLPVEAARRLEAAVIHGWQSTAGALDREVLEFYRACRHLDKALKRACAIRPDAGERAAASLRRSTSGLWLRTQAHGVSPGLKTRPTILGM